MCHPQTARTWCTLPRVNRAMIALFLAALLHQSTRFIDRTFLPVHFRWHNSAHWGCQFSSAYWVREWITEDIYYTSYYSFRILFVHIGPCAALVVFNVLLFIALRNAQRTRAKLFAENRKSESRKLRDSNSTTIMLIVVVTVFLLVEIPLAVTTLLHVIQNATGVNIADYETLNLTILFSNFSIVLSYPVNFAIYCGMSRAFRETFHDLFMFGRASAVAKRGSEWSSRCSTLLANGEASTSTRVICASSTTATTTTNGGTNVVLTAKSKEGQSTEETML